MKKLILLACTAVLGLCAFGPVAKADGYYRDGYYGHRHFYHRYYRPYGFYGGPRVFVSPVFLAPLPPPVYYCPPPRPAYYEGRIEEEHRRPENYDNSK